MTIEELERIKAEHGGLRDAPVVLDPEVDSTDKFGRAAKGPNPTPKYRYIFNDGTTLVAVTRADGAVQIVDPGTALNKSGVAADKPDTTPKTVTTADGRVLQYVPASDTWKEVGPPKAAPPPKAPETVSAPPTQEFIVTTDAAGVQSQVKNPNYRPPGDPALPGVTLPAHRAGQRTDLAMVQTQADAYLAQLNADVTARRKTPAERAAAWTSYLDTAVKPAVAQATAEANAEADRVAQAARDATALTNRREDRVAAASERADVTAREKETTRVSEDRRDYAYKAGQDAVANEMKLMPFRVGSGYNDAFAGALNSMGGPQISGRALDVRMPDFSAIARQAAEQAYAIHGAPVAAPAAPGVPLPPPPPALTTLPVAPPVPGTPGYLPPPVAMPPSVGGDAGIVAPPLAATRDRWYA